MQKILLMIVRELVKYLDGYHLAKDPVRKKKEAEECLLT
jgi:hypothetical protein